MAAALAFHTLTAIAPLVIVAVAIAGIVLGRGTAHEEVVRVLNTTFGPRGGAQIDAWVNEASESGEVASLIGFLLMLVTASRLGVVLRSALDLIFDVEAPATGGFGSTVREFIERRLSAFMVVAMSGPVLLIVFASRALLTGLSHTLIAERGPAWLFQALQLAASVAVVAVLSAVVFRTVPDKSPVAWRHAWFGGALTSVLFNAGNAAVGLYLGRASVTATYGAAGSVIVVLLWLYFSAQMFFLGAEFTIVYSEHARSKKSDSQELSDEQSAERGAV